MRIACIVSALLAAAGSCRAQMWSTYEDFYSGANPWGPWSYGWKSTPTGAMTLYNLMHDPSPVMPGWTGTQFPSGTPDVAINPTNDVQAVAGTTILVPMCASWARPGAGGNEWSVFRFTTPVGGNFVLNAFFRRIELGSVATSTAMIRVSGLLVFTATVPADGMRVSFQSGYLPLSNNSVIEFLVGPGTGSTGVATEVEGYIELDPHPRCYANCDGSTTVPFLNVNDFICFLNQFFAGDPRANCTGGTSQPVLTIHDFGCFLNRFAAGCTAP